VAVKMDRASQRPRVGDLSGARLVFRCISCISAMIRVAWRFRHKMGPSPERLATPAFFT